MNILRRQSVPAGPLVIVKGPRYSDGDRTHRPDLSATPDYSKCDDVLWLHKIAATWAVEEEGGSPNQAYILDQLPAGYELWMKRRGRRIDKYLFGHPSKKVFISPLRFYPHFKFLMKHPEGAQCKCQLCCDMLEAPKSAAPHKNDRVASDSEAKGQPTFDSVATDQQFHPTLHSMWLTKLGEDGKVELNTFLEKHSMDWRADRPVTEAMAEYIPKQHSFIPRIGEIVLWMYPVNGEIRIDPKTGFPKIFDRKTRKTIGYPKFLGGIITQTPEEEFTIEDVLKEVEKEDGTKTSGFRIEHIPDPNSNDKSLSRKYTSVPLHCIRPFAFYVETMDGLPDDSWHQSILHCMKAFKTISITEPCGFEGTWPNATFYSKGLFHCAESLWIGDAIRIMPLQDENIFEVLIVQKITTKYTNLKATPDGKVTPASASKTSCFLSGHLYTNRYYKSHSKRHASADALPSYMLDNRTYGQWYHVHDPTTVSEIDHTRVLGRVFEADAINHWCPFSSVDNVPLVCAGWSGVDHLRKYANTFDKRLKRGVREWVWEECRMKGLGITHLGDLNVVTRERKPEGEGGSVE